MSYDLRIWSVKPVAVKKNLPMSSKWEIEGDTAYYKKNDWQIVITDSSKVEDEDITEGVSQLLPGINYVTDINLEPQSAPATAQTILQKIGKDVAKNVFGIIEDPQKDTLTTPSGVKRFTPSPRKPNERFALLEMSWWFMNPAEGKRQFTDTLITYFEKNLPEALPRRYGKYEPPQKKYEDGKVSFLKFVEEENYNINVWYATKPVMGINFSFPEEAGFVTWGGKKKFRANHISITFDASVLEEEGWNKQLHKFFTDVSMIIKPFYGEVRILDNYISGRGTYYSDTETEQHPVQSWWWTGIPQELGPAIVVGEPYVSHWSKVKEKGISLKNIYLVSTEDWSKKKSVKDILGKPPREIAQLKIPKYRNKDGGWSVDYNEELPPVFPFR